MKGQRKFSKLIEVYADGNFSLAETLLKALTAKEVESFEEYVRTSIKGYAGRVLHFYNGVKKRIAEESVLSDVQKLANRFSKLMREQLTADQLTEVNKRNKANSYQGCASHDFCDANMVMDQAFMEERDIDMSGEHNAEQDWLWVQWDQAWDIAKHAGFSLSPIEEPEAGAAEIRIVLSNSVITVYHSDGSVLREKNAIHGDWGKMWTAINEILK